MSEFWLKKMRTYFKVHDFDRNGYIRQDEFVGISRRLADALKAAPAKKEKLVNDMNKLWGKFTKAGDPKVNTMTAPILIESMKQELFDPDFIVVLNDVVRGMFGMLDVNEDGWLSPDEYEVWTRNMGFPEDLWDVRKSFVAIDANRDGRLSIDEFVRAFFDFLFSQDDNSSNKFFFGPLVD